MLGVSAGNKMEVLFVPSEFRKVIYALLKMKAPHTGATLIQYRNFISLAITAAMEIAHI